MSLHGRSYKGTLMHVKSLQSCPTVWDSFYNLLGSSVHRILQTRILDWVVILSFRVSSQPGIEPMFLMSSALAGWFFTTSATWETQGNSLRVSFIRTSLVAQTVKCLSAMQETRVWSLGREDPLEKERQVLLGKSHGLRILVGYSPWGHKESDMTERLHFTL